MWLSVFVGNSYYIATIVKQLFYIKPAEASEIVQPVLLIKAGERHFSFAVTNKEGDQFSELAYYSTNGSAEELAEILDAHPVLTNNFYKTLVSYDHSYNSLVPAAYYKEGESSVLLNALYGVNGYHNVIAEAVNDRAAFNVYAVSKPVHEWIGKQFKGCSSWNQFSVGLQQAKSINSESVILADFRTDDFTVVVVKNNQPLLTQTFTYQAPEDVVFQLLNICQQFDLSQREVRLLIAGLLDTRSALYKELYQYFVHIECRNAAWSTADSETPAHFFTSLNDLSRCVS